MGKFIHIEGMFPKDKYLLAQSSSGENNIFFHKGLSFAKYYVFLGHKWYVKIDDFNKFAGPRLSHDKTCPIWKVAWDLSDIYIFPHMEGALGISWEMTIRFQTSPSSKLDLTVYVPNRIKYPENI